MINRRINSYPIINVNLIYYYHSKITTFNCGINNLIFLQLLISEIKYILRCKYRFNCLITVELSIIYS